ncbi:MAG: heavy metal translocating P-type ATPase [Vicinamibacterales bacterium]
MSASPAAPSPAAAPVAPACCGSCAVPTETVFKVEGLCCSEEVAILERRLGPVAGVEHVSADALGQRLHVRYDASRLSATAIVDAVAETGMRAWIEQDAPVVRASSRLRGPLVAASAVLLAAGGASSYLGAAEPVSAGLYVLAALAGGVFPAHRAVMALRQRLLDINALMLIAVAGALVLGEWSEAGTVVFLFSVAQWLESRSMDRARDAIRALMDLAPAEARVRQDGQETTVPLDRVSPGALVIVRPGEKIPVDGIVHDGRSDINQAPITGESLPVEKGPGEEVYAGTINGHGALDITVTRHRGDTTLSRIIHLVESAQAQRAPSQQFIDRFARWYTPAVVALSLLVAVAPPILAGADAATWFYRALVLLVIACPCALVISTPVSIVSALAAAARGGVLIKGGAHLERLAAVRVMAFDKTGTLTRGEVAVVEVAPLEGATARDLLAAAASVEQRSEHPIAAAVIDEARRQGIAVPTGTGVRALPGLGAEGTADGAMVVVGNPRLFAERDLLTAPAEALVARFADRGISPVLVAHAGRVLGAIGIADRPREVASDVVGLLHGLGIRRLAMLTGDQPAAAQALAARLGIDDVRAGLLPGDKVDAVRELAGRHGPIAMVGDGVNDAPALAASDVGIVMGAIGSDAALETADVALMTDELQKLPYAVRLSRATMRNIQANIALSLLLKAVFLAAAIGGVATLWMAVLADTGASLLVVANALRLLRHA